MYLPSISTSAFLDSSSKNSISVYGIPVRSWRARKCFSFEASSDLAWPKLVTLKTYRGKSLTRRRIQSQGGLGDPLRVVNIITAGIVALFRATK